MMTDFLGEKIDPKTEPWSVMTSRGQEGKDEFTKDN